ncbi:MAG TPA: helix-turn-helix transcriptional regulator [Patescibacteria group bacterium]|nr:helix-turn-helix transcriptional regulator [Patescibacteria group bacterium]
MAKDNIQKLGETLKHKREHMGWSIRELARRTDLSDTTVMRIEQGLRAAPSPDVLAKLAETLELSLADLYTLAGYAVPADLPSMPAYLRVKYRNLPQPARDELNNYLERLKDKYGLDEDGPQDGEDE